MASAIHEPLTLHKSTAPAHMHYCITLKQLIPTREKRLFTPSSTTYTSYSSVLLSSASIINASHLNARGPQACAHPEAPPALSDVSVQ
jgi:hypothetical protein